MVLSVQVVSGRGCRLLPVRGDWRVVEHDSPERVVEHDSPEAIVVL